MSGKLLGQVSVFDQVKPFLKVKRERKQRASGGTKGRKKKGGKAAKEEKTDSKEDADGEQKTPPVEGTTQGEQDSLEPEDVLVISKIESVHFGEEKLILFSAIGYALYLTFLPLSYRLSCSPLLHITPSDPLPLSGHTCFRFSHHSPCYTLARTARPIWANA